MSSLSYSRTHPPGDGHLQRHDVVAILRPGEEIPIVDRIFHDDDSVRQLIGRFSDRSQLATCYEAEPGGYGLHRLLTSMGVACDVVAPSLIPKGSGERIRPWPARRTRRTRNRSSTRLPPITRHANRPDQCAHNRTNTKPHKYSQRPLPGEGIKQRTARDLTGRFI